MRTYLYPPKKLSAMVHAIIKQHFVNFSGFWKRKRNILSSKKLSGCDSVTKRTTLATSTSPEGEEPTGLQPLPKRAHLATNRRMYHPNCLPQARNPAAPARPDLRQDQLRPPQILWRLLPLPCSKLLGRPLASVDSRGLDRSPRRPLYRRRRRTARLTPVVPPASIAAGGRRSSALP